MKKSIFLGIACLLLSGIAYTQEAERIDITGFEGLDYAYQYTGGNIVVSEIDWGDLQGGATPKAGEQVLKVEYDNMGSAWQWNQMDFPEAVDLTGMTEVHMWVYVVPEQTSGTFEIRLDLPGGLGLGYRGISEDQYGEWVELVWQIDHISSQNKIAEVGNFGGFISPDDGANKGLCYIDEIFGYRPEGTPTEWEEITVWGVNEEDDMGTPKGWEVADSTGILVGFDEVTPSEGDNYAMFELSDGWQNAVKTSDAKGDFDRWDEVFEIMVDVRVQETFDASWLNFQLVIQSGLPEGDIWDAYGEMGIAGSTDDWETILWVVDISKHEYGLSDPPEDNPEEPGHWFQLSFTSNQPSGYAGTLVYFDNVRLVVPAQSDVLDWSLY
ncbi:hypothetical protein GF373_10945 [bacterium]|nr:hypothetical protein [bacterium]